MAELYSLPDGWEWKKLGDIGKISTGKTPPKANKEFYENGTIRFIKPPNLQNSYNIQKAESDEFVTEDGAKKSTLLPKNTLMVCCIGSLGKFALSNEKVITNQQINSIIFYDDIINYKYGYYYGFKLEKLLNDVANEAVVKIVNKTIFSNLDIPLPPLEEQKRIVVNLDNLFAKIDKAIALHQKNIDEADIFMASVLNDVFAELEEKYKKRTIGSFSKVGTGATPLKNRNDFYENGNINWITSKATNDDYVYESEQLITEIALNECRLKINPIGTIIVALYGQGKTRGQVSELMIESSTNQALATIIVDENESINTYLKYFLKKSYFDIREKASGGTQPNLNLSKIKNIEIEYPPLKTQQKVVAYLDEISNKMEKIKQIQKEKMQSLKALKASILDKAFKGEL
jgi:type I restriction enzyme, S subunit